MNRSEAWVRARLATIKWTSQERAIERADQVLAEFDARFRSGATPTATEQVSLEPLTTALNSYLNDPAGSDYQRGYLASLLVIADEFDVFVPSETLAALQAQLRP